MAVMKKILYALDENQDQYGFSTEKSLAEEVNSTIQMLEFMTGDKEDNDVLSESDNSENSDSDKEENNKTENNKTGAGAVQSLVPASMGVANRSGGYTRTIGGAIAGDDIQQEFYRKKFLRFTHLISGSEVDW